jgi:hypothetical protein
MADLIGICPVCGGQVSKRVITSGTSSAYRKDYTCKCGKAELIQKKYPNQQQEKYSHANRNRR